MFLTPVFLFVLFLVVVTKYLRRKRQRWEVMRSIPQPKPYPIIGNFLDVAKAPEQLFLSQRKFGALYYPIYKFDLAGTPAINILNPEDIELIVTDLKHNSKSVLYDLLRAWLGTGLLTSGGTKWHNRRKMLTPTFHFNILQDFITIFIKATERLVADLEKQCHQSAVDVVPPITQFTLLSIGETAMGIDLNHYKDTQKVYKDAIYEVGQLLTYRSTRPWLYDHTVYSFTSRGRTEKKLVKTLHNFSDNVISDRKRDFSSCSYSEGKRLAMLDLLLKYRSEGANIDDEGIREEVDTFMFEGHDTTAMAICFSLMLLANEREAQDEVYKEIVEVIGTETPNYKNLHELKYLDRCIKEILRLYPSVPFISRVSGSEIKTKTGHTIPADVMVNMQIYDMHHNPNVFPDPEKFDPDRFLPENVAKRHPFAHIPFSAGSRNCIGQKYAMLEIKTALCGILKKFVLEPVDTPKDIVFIVDMVLRLKGAVRVKFVPRK